jgi:hypothetical protein
VFRAYKFRLWTNANQERELGIALETHRRLYNSALGQRRWFWDEWKISRSYSDQCAWLVDERKTNSWFAAINCNSSYGTLRRLDRAFENFFRRVKAGQEPGYPRFKSTDRFDSILFPKHGNGIRLKCNRLRVQHVGTIRVCLHREVEGTIKTLSLKREADKWFVVLACEQAVNTPSAKADSFLEHATYWWRYAPLARSRPSTLKDYKRTSVVPIYHQSTGATVYAFSQRLWLDCVALRAFLTRVVRRHLFYLATSLHNFVGQYVDEARPAYIGNRSAKPVILDHALHVQAFHSDFAVARNQIIGNFVLVFTSAVGHPSVNASHLALGFLAVIAALLLARQRTLGPAQCWQLFLEKARISDLLTQAFGPQRFGA